MKNKKQNVVLAGIVMLLVLLSGGAGAQDAPLPSPKFAIQRYAISGNSLLPNEELERIVAPYTGEQKDFADIQRALEAVEQAYRARGYGVVRVVLPEQDITNGVVQFRVVEARVGKVMVEGNTQFDLANVRNSLPTVKEGGTPNTHDIARNLQILSEHPVKQTNVLLRSGSKEDEVDVNVKVDDSKPWRAILSLDDTGTSETGYLRSGIGFQHTNLTNRDDTLTAQYVTSPTNESAVSIYGVGYRMPFYNLNSSLDLIAGHSDTDSGTVQGLFNVSGSGDIFGARWNYYLPRWGEVEQKLSFGLDYRAFKNQVLIANEGLVPDITIHPASIGYSGLLRMAAGELGFYGALSANIPGGNDGTDAGFQKFSIRGDGQLQDPPLRRELCACVSQRMAGEGGIQRPVQQRCPGLRRTVRCRRARFRARLPAAGSGERSRLLGPARGLYAGPVIQNRPERQIPHAAAGLLRFCRGGAQRSPPGRIDACFVGQHRRGCAFWLQTQHQPAFRRCPDLAVSGHPRDW